MLHQVRYFLLGILLAGRPALAQVYEPGFLVRPSGDTLRGELENGFWNEPPTFLHYRASATAPVQLFQARQLRAFSFTGGRYYQRQLLPIDHAAETALDRLPRGNAYDVHQDSVLAEVLVEGPVMLWRVRQLGVLHLLVQRPGQPVLELAERQYLRELADGRWVVADGNNYRSQLLQYFGDCPAAVAASRDAAFTAAGLVEVVRAYYQSCAVGQGVAHSWLGRSVPRRRLALQGGVLAGMRYNRIESGTRLPDGPCTDCVPHPFGGLYAELSQPGRTMAVYGELTISRFQNTSQYYDYTRVGPVPFAYRALLGTARLGIRFLSPLPHEQYLLVGLGLEKNLSLAYTLTSGAGTGRTFSEEEIVYASPTLLPTLTAGWRRRRLTALFDVQVYRSYDDGMPSVFLGSNVALRLGASYRLGRHPDQR